MGRDRIGSDWIGLDWIGLDWIGLDWIGLDWIVGTGEIQPRRHLLEWRARLLLER
jgi:hypothetical protein